MKRGVALAALVMLVGPSIAAAAAEDALKPLQGEWEVISADRGGEAMLRGKSVMLTVKDATFTLTIKRDDMPDRGEIATVKIDSTKKPKTIDFIDKSGNLERVGIYEIEGDSLKMCLAPDKRPEEFKSPPDTHILLMVCQRQQAAAAPKLGLRERARAKVAATQIELFGTALDLYRLDMADYPTTDEGLAALVVAPKHSKRRNRWQGPYMERLPDDPWGKPYRYAYPGAQNKDSYDLWSSGPDGKSGTADDIGNWKDR
jgi:general secretion pathway protein G